MPLDKNVNYVYRIGSDNQYRFYWDGAGWHYEFLAGGVLFDEQEFDSEETLAEALAMHGMNLTKFHVDKENAAAIYSQSVQKKMKQLRDAGVDPCPKHGLTSKNLDNTCEACQNTDYPDDFKGTEG